MVMVLTDLITFLLVAQLLIQPKVSQQVQRLLQVTKANLLRVLRQLDKVYQPSLRFLDNQLSQ
jgi:hypothetical protein